MNTQNNDLENEERVALVTGGNRGIGLSAALSLSDDGYKVAITCRGEVPAEIKEAGILAVKCDVTNSEEIDSAFNTIEESLGPVDVLIANAGITRDGLVLSLIHI